MQDEDQPQGEAFRRPKRIVTARYREGTSTIYRRDAAEALELSSGLDILDRGIMSMLVDVFALHREHEGIPVHPPSYVAGLLGCGQRRWSEHVEPRLLRAHKLRRVIRSGIEVYILDPRFRAIAEDWAGSEMDEAPDAGRVELAPQPRGEPMVTHYAPVEPVAEAPDPASAPPAPPPLKRPVPQPSAYDVLDRAGLKPDAHQRGEFFWARSDHNAILSSWLGRLPLSEIVTRLARARHDGRLPKAQPNSLKGYERLVFPPESQKGASDGEEARSRSED